MTNNELITAWFAGFFEGEGSFGIIKGKAKQIAVSLTDLDVLERVQQNFGGSIYKITTRNENWKQAWLWRLGAKESVKLVQDMLPYLGDRRRARALEYLELIKQQEDRYNNRTTVLDGKNEIIFSMRKAGKTHQQIADACNVERSTITRYLLNKQ